MAFWVARNGQTFGPYDPAQVRAWLQDGTLAGDDPLMEDGGEWRVARELFPPVPASARGDAAADDNHVRRIADYERISAILWAVIGVLQVLTLVGALAGLWNLIAAWSRHKLVPHILARSRDVPAAFESTTGLVIIAIVNLLLGGFIGVLFVVLDVVIRDMVLSRRDLFDREPIAA